MRCDVNISLRPQGQEEFGTRTEIKNVNSFRFVEKAIAVERDRQMDILEDGGSITQETRLYDAERNETRPMRSKEVANDYRYFPEPDLLPIVIDDAYVSALRAQLPELPRQKRERFQSHYGLNAYDAGVIVAEREVADYFEATTETCNDAKLAANWIQGELMAALNRSELAIEDCPISASNLGQLITRIKDGSISGKIAKQVFETMWRDGSAPDTVIEQEGLQQLSDSGALEAMVADVITNNPGQVEQYLAAEEGKRKKLLGFFVGQIMKASKGQANPQMINQILLQKLDAAGQ